MDSDMARAQDHQDDNSLYCSPTPEHQGLNAPSDAGSIASSSLGSQVSSAPNRVSILCLNIAEIAPVSKVDETLDSKSKNWTAWSQSMDLLFSIANCWGYIDGCTWCPNANTDPIGFQN